MSDIRKKFVPPAIDQASFNCPHCGALAKQSWLEVYAQHADEGGTPSKLMEGQARRLANKIKHQQEDATRQITGEWVGKMVSGLEFTEEENEFVKVGIRNIFISNCYSCQRLAIWVHNRLVWPEFNTAPTPNPDLPEDIRPDYEEARTVLNDSPRSAAALLRLVIQKLCKYFEERDGESVEGKDKEPDKKKRRDLNESIAALVENGLDERVQKALDIVRVIGNHAIHPGQLDLKDDPATAKRLFELINLIVEDMITRPKGLSEMYEKIPEDARKAIEERDKKQ